MCTVTYLPSGSKSYFLTSNRDEALARTAAEAPKRYKIHDQSVFFPKDPQAGGTWIAASEKGFTLCLLNGALQKHKHQPPYRKSRGLVLLDFFKYDDPGKYANDNDFTGIEPFTLVIINSKIENKLHVFRWGGLNTSLEQHDPEGKYIWSSVTLYPEPVIVERRRWFNEWLQNKTHFSEEDIIDFHRFGGNGDLRNDFVMNRDNVVLTQSITQVNRDEAGFTMKYHDLIKEEIQSLRLI